MYIQRVFIVRMYIKDLAIIYDQIELIMQRYFTNHVIDELEAFLERQFAICYYAGCIYPIDDIAQNTIPARNSLLHPHIGFKRWTIKDRAIMHQRPCTALAIVHHKGMAIFIRYITLGRLSDMCEQIADILQ